MKMEGRSGLFDLMCSKLAFIWENMQGKRDKKGN